MEIHEMIGQVVVAESMYSEQVIGTLVSYNEDSGIMRIKATDGIYIGHECDCSDIYLESEGG